VNRRVLGSAVFGIGAALMLAGCGAGQITQTDTQLPAVDGALGQAGPVSVRDASLANRNTCEQAYTAGSNAPLVLTIANAGQQNDDLVSVTSPDATGATIDGQKTVVAGSTLVVGAGLEDNAAGTNTGIGHANVTLNGLKSVVWPGQLTPVTFTFRSAGPVTLDLPIASPTKTLSCAAQPAPSSQPAAGA
jgi:copper(I)-binding protein